MRNKYVWEYNFPASIYGKIAEKYPLLSDYVMARGILMNNEWKKPELLTERSINTYESDRFSKIEFDKYFKKYDQRMGTIGIGLVLGGFGMLVLLILISITDIDYNILKDIFEVIWIFWMLAAFFFIRTDVQKNKKKWDTPAICSRCQNIMCGHPYNDEVSAHDSNGIVYLCHSCNTKFIDQHPFSCSAA